MLRGGSGLVKRWYIAPALIFVLFGMALGPSVSVCIDVGTDRRFTVLAQLALTVILFNQAADRSGRGAAPARRHFRLLVIGIPLTIGLGTLTALLVLPAMPWWEAVCLAAIVAPTEVALIDALLEDSRIPERVRHALSTESGFYDGFALAAMLAALALASEQTDHDAGRWAGSWFAPKCCRSWSGLAVGWSAAGDRGSRQRGWMSDTWAHWRRSRWRWCASKSVNSCTAAVSSPRSPAGWRTPIVARRAGTDADAVHRCHRPTAGTGGVRDVRWLRGDGGLA